MKYLMAALVSLITITGINAQVGIGFTESIILRKDNNYVTRYIPSPSIYYNISNHLWVEADYSKRSFDFSIRFKDERKYNLDIFSMPPMICTADRAYVQSDYHEEIEHITIRIFYNVYKREKMKIFLGVGIKYNQSEITKNIVSKADNNWANETNAENILIEKPNDMYSRFSKGSEFITGISFNLSERIIFESAIIAELLDAHKGNDRVEFRKSGFKSDYPKNNLLTKLSVKYNIIK